MLKKKEGERRRKKKKEKEKRRRNLLTGEKRRKEEEEEEGRGRRGKKNRFQSQGENRFQSLKGAEKRGGEKGFQSKVTSSSEKTSS